MFFDKKEDVPVGRLIDWINSIDSNKWNLQIWNTKKNEFDEKGFPTMLSLLESNFRDNERVDISVSMNLGEPFRLYIKHKNPVYKTTN
jgi:hypothetical protein